MSKNLQTPEAHHEELVKGLYDQMKMILDSSEQPMDIYLDDNHKACNSKLAALLDYKSQQEWADIKGFLDPYVAEKSQETIVRVLGCNKEDDRLNHTGDLEEERRRNHRLNSHIRANGLQRPCFRRTLRVRSAQVSASLSTNAMRIF